jgi:hypothetical protein
MRHSLLNDPLIRVRLAGGGGERRGVQAAALPQVLAWLTDGEDELAKTP